MYFYFYLSLSPPTDYSERSAGGVLVQGGVHDAGVPALVCDRHVTDAQAVCTDHKPAQETGNNGRRL